ncbi:MAG TPA: hypothetical protein VHE99_06165 [Gammaproteobacteria bacterium]|nr:hypothetical protein [Gammaproteobacteria bacterium]
MAKRNFLKDVSSEEREPKKALLKETLKEQAPVPIEEKMKDLKGKDIWTYSIGSAVESSLVTLKAKIQQLRGEAQTTEVGVSEEAKITSVMQSLLETRNKDGQLEIVRMAKDAFTNSHPGGSINDKKKGSREVVKDLTDNLSITSVQAAGIIYKHLNENIGKNPIPKFSAALLKLLHKRFEIDDNRKILDAFRTYVPSVLSIPTSSARTSPTTPRTPSSPSYSSSSFTTPDLPPPLPARSPKRSNAEVTRKLEEVKVNLVSKFGFPPSSSSSSSSSATISNSASSSASETMGVSNSGSSPGLGGKGND